MADEVPSRFVGRKRELESLGRWATDPRRSQLSALYGRRRIGKTRLVEEAGRGKRFFKFEGLEGADEQTQRAHFAETLYRHSGSAAHKLFRGDNWIDYLHLLSEYLGDDPAIVLFRHFQVVLRPLGRGDFETMIEHRVLPCCSVRQGALVGAELTCPERVRARRHLT